MLEKVEYVNQNGVLMALETWSDGKKRLVKVSSSLVEYIINGDKK